MSEQLKELNTKLKNKMEEFETLNREFDKRYLEVRGTKKNLGKVLVGALIIETKKNIEGDTGRLEEEKEIWESRGGKATILYSIKDNFKKGIIYFESILQGIGFFTCDKGSEEQKREEYSKKVNSDNKGVAFYMDAVIE